MGLDVGLLISVGTSVPLWTPNNMPSIVQYLDMTVTGPNGKPGGVTESSNLISSVPSLKTGATLTFDEATNKPTLKANALGTLSSIQFAGAQALKSSATITLNNFLIVSLVKTSVAGKCLYEHSPIASDPTKAGLYMFPNIAHGMAATRVGAVFSTYTPNLALDGTWHIVEHAYNLTHGTHTLTIDGVLQTLTSGVTGNPSGSYADFWFIGCRNADIALGSPMTGEYLFQSIGTWVDTTDTNLRLLRTYLANKASIILP